MNDSSLKRTNARYLVNMVNTQPKEEFIPAWSIPITPAGAKVAAKVAPKPKAAAKVAKGKSNPASPPRAPKHFELDMVETKLKFDVITNPGLTGKAVKDIIELTIFALKVPQQSNKVFEAVEGQVFQVTRSTSTDFCMKKDRCAWKRTV